ncbi:MAG: aspartate aminotransferase family protein [Sandaracinaceae bacterium]
MAFGGDAPLLRAEVPGPVGRRWVEALARTECPALTARRARRAEAAGAPYDPIVWVEALGANVRDADGNVYVDLTAGFSVASVGHRHPRVVEAVRAQAGTLLHALGDVHPSDVKVQLLERLAAIAPFPEARTVLGLNGSDAITAALKTALLATGRPGVVAFEGGYHGLMYGPLAACGYRDAFRDPFEAHLSPHVAFAPYARREGEVESALEALDRVLSGAPVGAVLIEPALGRGGALVPPAAFLRGVAARARAHGAVLIVDEIFVGLGRLGRRFGHRAAGVEADLICLGKALGGGMPLSACVGRADVMAAWGDPDGEALHTATFAGHPLACAAALAALDVLDEEDLSTRARELGDRLRSDLERAVGHHPSVRAVRATGLLAAVELDGAERTLRLVRRLLERGYLVLPAGPGAEAIALTPPLTIPWPLLEGFVAALAGCLAEEPA